MKTIKNYNDFILEGKYNQYAYKYIHNQISEKEFNDYLFSELMTEGIIEKSTEILNTIKERLIDTFFTIIIEAKKLGVKVLTKLLNIASKWTEWLKKFNEKHPTLTKVIVIFIIISILMVLSSGVAHAADITNAADGKLHLNTTHVDACNAAIHYLDVNKVDFQNITGTDIGTFMEAKKYIIDMVDGKFDNVDDISKAGQAIGKAALDNINDMIQKSNESGDIGIMKKIMSLIAEGGKHTFIVPGS